ncbi:MAG: RluA family pseudouridine synthase [Deltaproteobacteria bacterium]|nr:RluA family pseudouridine synthase [Deltaproteobacteria bacterium]
MDDRPDGIDPEWMALDLVVGREHAGWRADRFVAARIPRLSRTRVQHILRRAAIDDSGRPIKPNRVLAEGERITLFRPAPVEPDTPRSFGVVYEDEQILAVDKPAGLPVHPTARYHRNTLTALLAERYGDKRPILAHRIDSETSGIVLCGKTPEAERALKILFLEREVSKTYLAVVRGVPTPPEGRIEVPLGLDRGSVVRVKMAYDPQGLPALTEYRVLRAFGDMALVEARPRTGRQHQIRAHLAHIGHPIVGDKIYADETIFVEYAASGMTPELAARAGFPRQALHAAAVSFVHPFEKRPLTIESPLPADILGLVNGRTPT